MNTAIVTPLEEYLFFVDARRIFGDVLDTGEKSNQSSFMILLLVENIYKENVQWQWRRVCKASNATFTSHCSPSTNVSSCFGTLPFITQQNASKSRATRPLQLVVIPSILFIIL